MSLQPSSSFLERRHASTHHPVFVVILERRLLAIDGIGEPGASDFRLATSALRTAAGRLSVTLRREHFFGATQPAVLESCWWPSVSVPLAELPAAFTDRSTWHWRQMIEVPSAVEEGVVQSALEEASRRSGLGALFVRRLVYTEGAVAQVLHVGGHRDEAAAVAMLWSAIEDEGFTPTGLLHILQLADPERAPAGHARAIIRQPIA